MATDRRQFLQSLAVAGAALHTGRSPASGAEPVVEARPSALFRQPDGRANLVRVTVTGLDAPAARAVVIDRHGALVATAGLLPQESGLALSGEVWVPLPSAADYRIEVEVGRQRVARRRVRLTPPRRWTLYWLSSIHTDVGYTDVQERALEVHRRNLDAALARLPAHPDFRFAPECALQILSFLENRSAEAGDALVRAIRDGKIGFPALYANLLTGILSHETLARAAWPAGLLARARGLSFIAAQISDVPGQTLTFPMMLAASGVKYLASGVNPERAVPLLPDRGASPGGEQPISYPQLHYWEGPDGSRVLHWRAHHYSDATRLGFDRAPEVMGRRISDWVLNHPVFLSPSYPYDLALLYGADVQDNAAFNEQLVANVEEFNRRYAFPRIVVGRAEEFFRDVERRYGPQIPVRKGDSGLYWEDGAASTARELAVFRGAQLAARAAEIVALWDDRLEPRDGAAADRIRRRAEERRAMWRSLLLFGEHTWGADVSVSAPESRQTVEQWAYKRRFVEGAAAAARQQLAESLLRVGRGTDTGRGRIVFNASSWPRSDVVQVPGGAGRALFDNDRELPAVDFPDGSALVVTREVPPLGYLALREADRDPRPLQDEGGALEADAAGWRIRLDPGSGAIASLAGPDGAERVKTTTWAGANQFVYATGGQGTALWTDGDRSRLATPPALRLAQATLIDVKRERLPGIGVRLTARRALEGFPSLISSVTVYDELPWIDIENRLTKTPTLEKEALYVAFPFAFTAPTVEVEVPLGRMTVERDQQPGSCRDWYCHANWVSLMEGTSGVLWSGPDTPLFTLNDLFRGAWRRRIVPDGTLFAYVMNNYWHTNYAARQGGDGEFRCRFRISVLPPGDPAEPVRRGWAACDPLYVSERFDNRGPGPLIGKDRALFLPDKGLMVVAAKPADDGEGAIVKLLDVTGQSRPVGIWPAAYAFQLARRVNLVEMNGDSLPVGADRRAGLDIGAWGLAAARLFTPREASG